MQVSIWELQKWHVVSMESSPGAPLEAPETKGCTEEGSFGLWNSKEVCGM